MSNTRWPHLLGQKKKSKYGNQKTVVDGRTFDSKKEAQRYSELMLLLKAGEVVELILQPEFLLQPAFTKNGIKYPAIKYIADFMVTYKDGRVEVEDTKGMQTKAFKLKHKLFEYKYPNLTLKII